ncbi:2OG-Fe(II) oxygenase [Thozetella sp. PMI_491]|nr:2OG-Fe(II) oxygenase [Thozetella sp. PMI_491]
MKLLYHRSTSVLGTCGPRLSRRAPALQRKTLATANVAELGKSMPPGHTAQVRLPETFVLPDKLSGCEGDRALGRAMIRAWRRDGIFQVATAAEAQHIRNDATATSHRFFRKPHEEKAACVDSQSFAGYIGSGEEITDGVADYSEIFTVVKDLPLRDPRVRARWPCHGPCPWPDVEMKESIERYMRYLGSEGEKILRLTEYGMSLPETTLTRYTVDGWHHMRMLRFPATHMTNGKGENGRGIGSHTDYGMLVMASQDDVGGLFVRPPRKDEHFANWKKSAAGLREKDSGWVYIPPVPNVHTVFLGDMMQYLTSNYLMATPHKVGLNTRERFVFAYFHEPSFQAVLKPVHGYASGLSGDSEAIHYGTHFTNMFLRNYPDRITTKRLLSEGRFSKLQETVLRTMGARP